MISIIIFDDDWMNLVPDMSLLDQQFKFSEKSFLWAQSDIVQFSLLKMLHDVKAPLYLFDKIMNWAAEANAMS